MSLTSRCYFASTSGVTSVLAGSPWSLPHPLLTKPIDFATLRNEIDQRVERAA
jgi:hypothetical protein